MVQTFFSAGAFAPNWAGLVLIVLAVVLLIHELHISTYGVLTAVAVVSLAIGVQLLVQNGNIDTSLLFVYAVVGFFVGLALTLFSTRGRQFGVATSTEDMIGRRVTAITPLLPEGRVRYYGENWAALLEGSAGSADPDSELEITAVEGLCLHVRLAPALPLIETYPGSLPK